MLANLRCVFAFMSLIKLCCTHPILDLHVHLHLYLHLPRYLVGVDVKGGGGERRGGCLPRSECCISWIVALPWMSTSPPLGHRVMQAPSQVSTPSPTFTILIVGIPKKKPVSTPTLITIFQASTTALSHFLLFLSLCPCRVCIIYAICSFNFYWVTLTSAPLVKPRYSKKHPSF